MDKELVTEEERTEVYEYLTQLRASEDAPNMMLAYESRLREEFGFDKYTAKTLASDWRKWFPKQSDETIRSIENK